MIVYSRLNNNRKKEFRLITTIEDVDGKRIVRKKTLEPSALVFLNSFFDKYETLKKSDLKVDVAKPTKDGESVVFDFIRGSSLFYAVENHIRNGSLTDALNIIEAFRSRFIDRLHRSKDENNTQEFKRVFGSHLMGDYAWVKPAIIDLNLDNIIENDNKYTIFDYEWMFDFGVPKEFLFFRIVVYLIFSLQSKGLNTFEIFTKYKDLFTEEFIKAEYNFQKHVSNIDIDYEKYSHMYQTRLAFDDKYPDTFRDKIAQIDILKDRVKHLESVIESKNTMLKRWIVRPFYLYSRVWNKFVRIIKR